MRSRCHCALKNAFLYRMLCMSWKNNPFPQNKRFSFTESLTLCPQKPLVFTTKTPLVRTTFYCPQKPPFLRTKAFLLHKPFLAGFKNHLFTYKKPFIRTNLSELPPKAILFCPPQPIPTALNLLSAKNFHFHKPKVFLLHKSFLNCYPKQLFSTLHLPFAPPLTYCLQRMRLFFCCSL